MVLHYEITESITQEQRLNEASPQFLLRLGGLPIDSIDELRFERTTRQAEVVLDIEKNIAARKDRLVDMLHDAVGVHKEDQKLRRKLLAIKRDVFNTRMPNNSEACMQIAEQLEETTQVELKTWIDLWVQHQEKTAMLAEVFLQEMYQKREALKHIINEPDFRKGVFLSSTILDQAIASYLNSDNLRLNREARTVERSLVEYLLRTACKTSPFSTLTSISAGIIDAEEADLEQMVTYEFESMEKMSFTRLNIAILSRLSWLIFSTEQVRYALPIQVTPGWRRQKNRIRYLRRTQELDDIDPEKPVAIDKLHENVFFLPVGPVLKDLLDLIGDGRILTFSDLVSQLRARESYSRSEEELNTYLQYLLRLGFLIVPSLHLDMHSNNPLADYRQGLLTIATPLTQRLAEVLEQIDTLVAAYATADLGGRRDILGTIKLLLQEGYHAFGGTEVTIPRTLVYEDTVVQPQKLAIHPERWQQLHADLAEFQRILPVFDMNLQRRLVTKGYFRARFGAGQRCEDFLAFADSFNQEFFDYFLKHPKNTNTLDARRRFARHENHFKLPEVEMLDDARQAVADYMARFYAQRDPECKELVLDDDFLRAIAPLVPEHLNDVQSHTLFAQLASDSKDPLLVINRVYAGLTLMFSRFADFFANEQHGYSLVTRLRATLASLQTPNAVFAELNGGYETTNLNLHPQLTDYELICPGDLSTRAPQWQIGLDDLYIEDDTATNTLRLYSRRLGKEVIPIYLGFLMPMALPEIQQILLNFSSATLCPIDLWLGIDVPATGNVLVNYPRVRYKNLVFHREMWKFYPQYLPQRETGQTDADYYLRMLRWQRENDIPSNVFVTPDTGRPEKAPDEDGGASPTPDMKLRKPLYVDFENFFAVSLLEATARAATSRLVMTEMLPHRDALWFQQNGHPYVSEFILEMNRREEHTHA